MTIERLSPAIKPPQWWSEARRTLRQARWLMIYVRCVPVCQVVIQAIR